MNLAFRLGAMARSWYAFINNTSRVGTHLVDGEELKGDFNGYGRFSIIDTQRDIARING
jgi:sRNA-binding regulator protein Hfq